MRSKFAIGSVACAAMLAATLGGCSGGDQGNADSGDAQQQEVQQGGADGQAAKDFDGSGFSDTGEGTMYLSTAGGTSEGGKIPQIASAGAVTIDVVTEGMDGSVCVVYVDGVENSQMNAGERGQSGIVLTGPALEPGVHTVELVKMDGDKVAVYKVAQYEVA